MLTPYYKDQLSEIYCMDCIAGMNELADSLYDLLVTSPPYGVGKEYEENQTFGDYLKLISDFYTAGFRIIKRGGYAIIVTAPYYYTKFSGDEQKDQEVEYLHHVIAERAGWVHECSRIWAKDFASLSDRYSVSTLLPKQEHEVIITFRKPGGPKRKPREQDLHPHSIWSTAGVHQAVPTLRHHSAAYPERLVEMILAVYADKGDTVIEPFLGSGTTLAVAKKFGIHGIGFETDKESCDYAAIRCSQQTFDLDIKRRRQGQFVLPDDAVGLPVTPPEDF